MVRTDADLAAVFPFQTLSPSLTLGGFSSTFDAAKEKESVATVRKWITDMKARVTHGVTGSHRSAIRKADQYLRMLDSQLQICDRTDEAIDALTGPFPRATWPPQS